MNSNTLTGAAAIAALLTSSSALATQFSLPLAARWESSVEIEMPDRPHGDWQSSVLEFGTPAAVVGAESAEDMTSATGTTLADGLVFPLRQNRESRAFTQFAFGFYVDNDAAFPNSVRDYAGGTWTYDLEDGYNHAGSDFILAPFHWYQMDNEAPEVVAALGGVVEAVESNHFDRQCSWITPLPPVNGVRIRHDDGTLAIYLHMRQGSLDHLSVGQRVQQGDRLGQVASSGFSLLPHLHFELRDANLDIIDPFAGPGSQPETLWRHQPAYQQTDVLRISTHSAPPTRFQNTCSESVTNLQGNFAAGDRIYASVAIRHQPVSQLAPTIIAYMPDGTEAYRETIPLSAQPGQPQVILHTISADLPPNAPPGVWRLRVLYNNRVYHGHFQVGDIATATGPATALLPSSRSVTTGQPATAFLTAVNSGSHDAHACHIRPGRPFDGAFSFQPTDPQTNQPVGSLDVAIGIPAGESRSFVVAATPAAGSEAAGYDLPVSVQCANSPSSLEISGVNSLRLSFSSTPAPDLIAIGSTVGNTGILDIPAGGSAAFAVATANVGAAGTMTLRPVATGDLSLDLTICETNPATGACMADRSASLTRTYASNETASFAVFARSEDSVPFTPATRRVFLEAVDDGGISRGSTSVAVRTPAGG